MKKSIFVIMVVFLSFIYVKGTIQAANLEERMSGKILLQVEQNGEAWYVSPLDNERIYLRDGVVAYQLMRESGLGITNVDLNKIPVGIESRFEGLDTDGDGLSDRLEEGLKTNLQKIDTDGDGHDDFAEITDGYNPLGSGSIEYDQALVDRLRGEILLQVESKGEAWYLNPTDGKRYYMQDGEAAYQIMRYLSLGITDDDLAEIAISEQSAIPGDIATYGYIKIKQSSGNMMDQLLVDYEQGKITDMHYIKGEFTANSAVDVNNYYQQLNELKLDFKAAMAAGEHFEVLIEESISVVLLPIVVNSYMDIYPVEKNDQTYYAVFTMFEMIGTPYDLCEMFADEDTVMSNEECELLVKEMYPEGGAGAQSLRLFDDLLAIEKEIFGTYDEESGFRVESSDKNVIQSKMTFEDDLMSPPNINNAQCMLSKTSYQEYRQVSLGYIASLDVYTKKENSWYGYIDEDGSVPDYLNTTDEFTYNSQIKNMTDSDNIYIAKIEDPTIAEARIEKGTVLIKGLREGETRLWLGDKGIPSSDYDFVENSGCYLSYAIKVDDGDCDGDGFCYWGGTKIDRLLDDGYILDGWH